MTMAMTRSPCFSVSGAASGSFHEFTSFVLAVQAMRVSVRRAVQALAADVGVMAAPE
jgi:hypothetical protein